MTGFMLMQGQGTNLSVPLAVKFFRDAAEQNYVAAQYVLGQIYWKGLGVPADKKPAKNGCNARRTTAMNPPRRYWPKNKIWLYI